MIKHLVNQLMLLIDSGKLLRKPFKWLYVLSGVLCFLPFVAYLVAVVMEGDSLMVELGYNFYTNFVSVFIFILFGYSLLVLGLFGYRYWINRRDNLDVTIKTSSRAVAIPLIADRIQCVGQINSLFLVLIVVNACVLAYIACMLTNGFGFYSKLGFIWMLVGAVVGVAVVAFLAYMNMLITKYIAERIKLVAQISNDVQSIAVSSKGEEEKEAVDETLSLPTVTDRDKRLALGAIVLAAVLALFVALGISIADGIVVGKSIYKPVKEKGVMRIERKLPGYSHFYNEVRDACDASESQGTEDVYKKIKYKRLYKYINNYYQNSEFKAGILAEANNAYEQEQLAPYMDKVQAEVTKWRSFIEANDPSRYLVVTIHTSYYQEYSWWSSWTRPQFYFSLEYPLGKIKDASVTYVPRNANGKTHSGAKRNTERLSVLISHNSKDEAFYYGGVDDGRFWDKYSMKVIINSVTLEDGTVISAKALEEVPASIKKYIDEETEENLIAVIRDLVDSQISSREEYTTKALAAALEKEDALCYDFAVKYLE
jgi:hypothetical protein